jgi:methionyl-tRNA formyltransferase
VWLQRRIRIGASDSSGDLFPRLATLGADALIDTLPAIERGDRPTPQDASQVTLAPKIERETARIDWRQPAATVSALLRAMDPAPGAWTTLDGDPAKLFRPRAPIAAAGATPTPGTIVPLEGGAAVACADALLPVSEIQPAGRRRVATADWLRGAGLDPGAAFR